MPIQSPVGTLDFVNARIGASEIRATSNIGVANVAPTKQFSVGDKFHVSTTDADAVTISGNVVASVVKVGSLEIVPSYDFAAVSNVGNTTSNIIQFANATTGFTTTANVEIGGNITLTANAQVKVGSNVLAEYTGPHRRDPKEVPLKKYPEIAFEKGKFDSNPTTNTFVQAGYTFIPSSSLNPDGWPGDELFDGHIGVVGSGWLSEATFSDGTPLGSAPTLPNATPSAPAGEYITVKMPKKIKLSHMLITPLQGTYINNAPISGKIYGGVDGTNWTEIGSFSGFTYAINQYNQINGTSSSYYSHFALVATAIANPVNPNWVGIGEWELYGYEEPAPVGDLSLDTTLKSTFNSVRSNNYVMYFDGNGFIPGDTNSNNLVDNSSTSVIHHNATYDSTGKYWTLDGSTESNVTTGSLGFEGDVPHTVSMWVNSSNLDANATTQQLFSIGSGYDKSFLKVDDTQIAANTWHNVTYAYQGEGGSKVTYVDGRKVEETQVEDTFGDYPPFAMTDYEVGGYRVSASSELPHATSYKAYQAFDNIVTGNNALWLSENRYGTNGVYTGSESTTVSGTAYSGEWLQIELPHKLKVSYVAIQPQNDAIERSPLNGVIAGSNDGTTWNLLDSFTGITTTSSPAWSATVPVNFALTSSTAYKYFRLVITATQSTTTYYASIQNVQLYGHKEGDLTRFPEPTRVLKYPHVAMTGPAQRGYVASASSSQTNQDPYKGFTLATAGASWVSGLTTDYNGSNNDYNDTTYRLGALVGGGNTEYGEWLKLELPHKLIVNKMILKADPGGAYGINEAPDAWKIYGSNDDTNWVELLSVTGATPTTTGDTRTISNSTAYKYIAIVITSVYSFTQYTRISNIEYYGTEEDTGTPAIVGGPFAGKVANFRVYDQYLGDERIQEIYDAQKDAFGHKKSSMTFYKGRIGVGTTEPEGALTVIDEPHALAKFPARAVSADDSYVEGDGETVIRAADGSGYQAFDGLTSTSWTAAPTRNTRLSKEVDFGAWLKIQTPESVSLKKAEIESNPDWRQVGNEVQGTVANEHFGRSLACSHDGTRVIAGASPYNTSQGLARVYDWNGSAWTQVGQTLTGTASGDKFAKFVAMSGDGNIIAIAAPFEHVGGSSDKGTVRVYYLNGSTWTVLPDSGSLTESETGAVDAFVGSTANAYLGNGAVQLSYDGKTIAMCEYSYSGGAGRVLVYQYSNGAWSYKGTGATQFVGSAAGVHFGFGLSMSEDGNCLAIGTLDAGYFVEVYTWNGSAWSQKGSRINQPAGTTTNDYFGQVVSISNDGNTLAIGMKDADIADGAIADNNGLVLVYHWTGSAWGTPHKLQYNEIADEEFGLGVVLSGDGKRLVVCAGAENNYAGELFTFEYTGDSWIMRTPGVQGLDGYTPDGHLGWGWVHEGHPFTISRDGSTIVAGELGYDTPASNAGRFRVFSMPSNIKSIWGSNDDTNWTKITTAPTREEATSNVAGFQFGYDDRLEIKNLDNPNYYKYHAIVADAFTRLKDVKLFGVRKQGSSTLHDGALTLTKNLDVPRIGPPIDADDTPRRDRLVVEYNTSTNPVEDGVVRDTSGRGDDGAFYGGAFYNAANKALVFDGVNDYIKSGNIGNLAGAYVNSGSFWVNLDVLGGIFMQLGEGPDLAAKRFQMVISSTNEITFGINGANTKFANTGISVGSWFHVAYSYDGGLSGPSSTAYKLYVNGVSITGPTSGVNTVALNLNANAVLAIGADHFGGGSLFNGQISNFKLYDTVLTAQEVKTLYDMGRCDEGHHVVNFSKTRVGIGLGDGEAPRATLDVRGDINVQGTITTFRHPYGPSYSLTTISPDIWAIAGESTARIGGGAISYTSGVSIKYHNGVPMWFFGGRDENVDILNTINHTTNTWSVAIAIAKKPESWGALFNQISNDESNSDTNHRFFWNGNFSIDEFRPSGNGGNTGTSYITIPDESVVYIKKTGTGTDEVYVYVNGGLVGRGTSAETYSGITPDKIRLGRRTRYSGYAEETPLYMGIAAIAVWDSTFGDFDISKYITYQSLTAK